MWRLLQGQRLSGAAGIEVRQSPGNGRSVVATRPFRCGEIIEVSPFLKLPAADREAAMVTVLYYYYFLLSARNDEIAVGLGYSALYNHSVNPTAVCSISNAKGLIAVRARRNIPAGKEISINYNGIPDDVTAVCPAPRDLFKESFTNAVENRHLYVANSPGKGRGVFAARPIPKGAVVEICPYLSFSAADHVYLSNTRLADYTFAMDAEATDSVLALGFGSLYNHSGQPNATYYSDTDHKVMLFYAELDIPAGREICINYGGASPDEGSRWFASRNMVCRPF